MTQRSTAGAAGSGAVVGVTDHSGWATLVTVGADGAFLDRRRVELIDDGLPIHPHHHEGQSLPLDEAVALVERVRASAERHARDALAALAAALTQDIAAIAIRVCPPLPETIAERITNYRAQNMADAIMFRQELASAAQARGWRVHWYDAKSVFADAARALQRKSLDALLDETGAAVGPPWQKDHKQAMAAALMHATRARAIVRSRSRRRSRARSR